MWKAAAGGKIGTGKPPIADEDDWETDPDFVVRYIKL